MEVKNYALSVIESNGNTQVLFKNVKSFYKHYYLFYEKYGITESMLPKPEDITSKLSRGYIYEIIGNKDILKLKLIPIL